MKIKVWEIVDGDHAVLHGEIIAREIKPFAKHLAEQRFPGLKKYKLMADNGEELEFDPTPPNENAAGSYVNWSHLANCSEEEINELYDDLQDTFGRGRTQTD